MREVKMMQEADGPPVEPVSTEFAKLVDAVITPLSDETKELFRPIKITATDRLGIELSRDGNKFTIETYAIGANGDHFSIASYQAHAGWQERIPEREKLSNSYNTWEFAATDFTAIIIAKLWPAEQIVFKSEYARIKYQFLITRFIGQMGSARACASYKLSDELPDPPKYFVEHPTLPLRRHQKAGMFITADLNAFGLFMDMGTGKTPTGVARIDLEARRKMALTGKPLLAIVVAPKNVRANWGTEFHRFSTCPGQITILRGGLLNRVKQITEVMLPPTDGGESMYSVVVASYQAIINSWEAISMIPWDLCFLDESHNIKNVYAKRWKHFLKLRDLCSTRAAFTGTPITNTVLDLYPQLEFLGEGLSGFSNWKAFRKYYCKYEQTGQGMRLSGFQNLPMLTERLARLSFQITKEEAMPDLPPKSYDIVECSMGSHQITVYNQLRDQLIVEIEAELTKGTNAAMTAENCLTRLLRLAQITAGFMKTDPQRDLNDVVTAPGQVIYFKDCPKLDELVEDLKTLGKNEKAIVWCCFKPMISRISERLATTMDDSHAEPICGIKHVVFTGTSSDRERENATSLFNNDPMTKVFLGNPAAGGEGINLKGYNGDDPLNSKTNCSRVLFYACNWSSVKRRQAEDRAHRDGTRVPIQVRDLLVLGTIDEQIKDRLFMMRDRALSVQDVKEILVALKATKRYEADE